MPKRVAPLTTKAVEALKPPDKGDVELWDGTEGYAGFGLRCYASGRKSWIVKLRVGDTFKRETIGQFPSMTLAEARKLAGRTLDKWRDGDPTAGTFAELVSEYQEREIPKLARGRDIDRIITKELLPSLGRKKLDKLRRRDAIKVLDRFDGRPGMAHKVQEVLKRLGNYAVRRDLVEASPFVALKEAAKPKPRDRVLGDEELQAVWRAAGQLGYPFGPLTRLLILTGQRLNEVAGMTWAEVDLEARTWTMAAGRTKSRRAHTIPLSDAAARVLEDLRGLPLYRDGDHVFSSTRGATFVRTGSQAKRKLDALSGVTEPWRFHDLRRTLRTGLARLGIAPHVCELILNHQLSDSLHRTYDRHHYLEEQEAALQSWGRHVEMLGRGMSVVEAG